ncbi:methionine synthase II [Klebsiella michiganensis]|uniref:Methionine synthase II n=1 Tax=Klebsiella michiganensis TaxID=1134687 RepID=A0A7H4MYI0_9ENTR|nr:methionine synthase II [Klebsiella michiganensis]
MWSPTVSSAARGGTLISLTDYRALSATIQKRAFSSTGYRPKRTAFASLVKLAFGDHPMLEDFRYLKSISGSAQPKMTIPSPSVLHFRGGRKDIDATVYPDLADYFDDLAITWRAMPFAPSTMRAAAIYSLMTPSGPTSAPMSSDSRCASAAKTRMSWRAFMPAF